MSDSPKATIIVSIYRDTEALNAILCALELQTEKSFSVIISEDGEDPGVASFLDKEQHSFQITHLTQKDEGFRKNRAINRAILSAPAEYLIFIDGDCVPHPEFVKAHLRYAKHGVVSCGRRIELGSNYSTLLRNEPRWITKLSNPWRYLMLAPQLHKDGIKNYELGFYLPLFQPLLIQREIPIVGCNFSVYREDLIAINGFDEAYTSPGIGEDADVEWRLRKNGIRFHNIKLTALQYHLYHPRSYHVSEDNKRLFGETKNSPFPSCTRGIDGHR